MGSRGLALTDVCERRVSSELSLPRSKRLGRRQPPPAMDSTAVDSAI
jgi:hypothetical protein